MANTIGWGKGTQNNTIGWGKYQNTIDAGSVYADSYAGETVLVGASAAFSYSASSFHQGEADPTPTITGTTGGTFSATPSGLSINTSTGTIDLDNSTIQSYTITYTVSGVSANQTLAVTASPFIANNFSMNFDGVDDYIQSLAIISLNTVSLWFKPNSTVTTGSSSGVLIGFGTTDFRNAIYLGSTFSALTNELITITNQSLNYSYYSQASGTIDTNWHHLAIVHDGSKYQVYLDGSPVTTSGSTPLMTSQQIVIGARGEISSFFNGKIDEVAIWDAALSSDAIAEIYNATYNNTGKVLDLNTDTGNYTSSANLQYWNRLGD